MRNIKQDSKNERAKTTVSIPVAHAKQLKGLAEKHYRSMSAMVSYLVEQAIKAEGE